MGSERVGHDWVTFTYLPTKGLFGLCKMELDSELWSLLTGFSLLCLFGNSKGIQNALLFIMWHSLRNFRKIKISSSCPPNTKYTKYKVGRTLQPSFSQNLVITENSSSSPKALLGWGWRVAGPLLRLTSMRQIGWRAPKANLIYAAWILWFSLWGIQYIG